MTSRYTSEGLLGTGGQGRVFAVRDAGRGDVLVALKERPADATDELREEFELLCRLQHPHIASVYDWLPESPIEVEVGGSPCSAYTQDLVPGVDFFSALQGATEAQQDEAVAQVLRALAYLHALQVVHLDLKPDNVLVALEGDTVNAHVLDFGIARNRGTVTDMIMGSRSYVAPERLRGEPVDPRADLYAFGVMLAEVSSGEWLSLYAFPSLSDAALRRDYFDEVGVHPRWLELVTALTAFEPSQRPASIFEATSLFEQGIRRPVALQTRATVAAILRAGAPVGRDDVLKDMMVDVTQGRARVLCGPMGIGRRTLARQVGRRLQLRGHPVEVWPGSESDQSSTALSNVLVRLLGGDGGFRRVGLGATEVNSRTEGLDPAAIEREIAMAVVKVRDRLFDLPQAAVRPVLIVEQFHSAPWTVRSLVRGLIEASEDGRALPVGIIVVADEHAGAARVGVEPLTRDDISRLLEQRLGRGVSNDMLAAALAGASGGNPGAVEALLALMAQRGELRFGPGGWAGPKDGVIQPLPEAFSGAVRARIDLLPDLQREVLSAVVWMRFPVSLTEVTAVVSSATPLLPVLSELNAVGLIRLSGHDRWLPSHDEVSSAVADWRPQGGAGAAHARVMVVSQPEGLALAWHTGGDAGAQIAFELGERAWHAGAINEAEKAYALSEELNPGSVEVLQRRANVADLLGPREVQIRCLEALIALEDTGSMAALRAQARLLWSLTRTANIERATQVGEAVLTLAEELNALSVYTAALVDLANVAIQRGDYEEGERRLLEARARTDAEEAPGQAARIANNLGNILSYRGDTAEALSAYGEALRLKRQEGDPVGSRIAVGNMGLMCLRMGRSGEALTHFATSLRAAQVLGHRRGEAWSLLAIAVLGIKGGALTFAERRARRALELASRLGDRSVACDARLTLAEILAASSRLDEAIQEAEVGLREALALEIGYSASAVRAVLADLVLDAEPERARALSALVIAEPAASPTYRAVALRVLADLDVAEGRVEQGWGRLSEALELCGEQADERLWSAALKLLPLLGDEALLRTLVARVRDGLVERERTWPAYPCDDQVDEAAQVDGPCADTWRQRRVVVALHKQLSESESQSCPEARPGSSNVRKARMNDIEDPGWCEALLEGNDGVVAGAALIGDIVRAAGAERGFLLRHDDTVLASSDLDGDAVSDAARKFPAEVLLHANQAGGVWRGQVGKGALWCGIIASNSMGSVTVVLQNRFDASAFEGLNQPPELGRLKLFAHVLHLRRRLNETSQGMQALEEAREADAVRSTEHLMELRRALEATREQLGPKKEYSEIIYDSALMQRMLLRVERVVDSELPVWIHGESGTGKELVARALHRHGNRVSGPFVAQNCGAIPATLFESEFFGHVRGAFTGAHRDQEGLFRRADGGTLFLDEVGDLPLEQQTKLLRVIETGEVHPVGGSTVHQVDVRLVCATHQDLEAKVADGSFREDLYYRLNVVRVDVPPLRSRPEDIPLLVEYFLTRHPGPDGKSLSLGTGVMKALMAYSWPGNVRELENELMRATLMCDGDVRLGDLSEAVRSSRAGGTLATDSDRLEMLGLTTGSLKQRVDRLEYVVLKDAMAQLGNKSQVARELGLSRAGLNMKLKRLGLWEES
ncbi:MAG: sigma 54-interacting transcriptional regulator [Myxococcota bacterium]